MRVLKASETKLVGGGHLTLGRSILTLGEGKVPVSSMPVASSGPKRIPIEGGPIQIHSNPLPEGFRADK